MTATPIQGQPPNQDTSSILQRMFTGHIVGQPAMGFRPLTGTVTASTNSTVTVAVDTFAPGTGLPTPTFDCRYEPRHHWSGSADVQDSPPPKGTQVLVCFPPNDPDGYGWALAFTGWPIL